VKKITKKKSQIAEALAPTPSQSDLSRIVQVIDIHSVLGVPVPVTRDEPILNNDEMVTPGVYRRIEKTAMLVIIFRRITASSIAQPANV
jgi:hypothetical protein